MGAVKRNLEESIARLIATQGMPDNGDAEAAIWDLVMSGEIAPLDQYGINWSRGNRTYRAHDRRLLA